MKKILIPFLLATFFSVNLFGQTGILENFDDNVVDPGWRSVPAGKFSLNEIDQALEVNASSVGQDWSNLEFNFRTQNITANPVIKLKIKTSHSFTLRIDVVDETGTSNNSSTVSQQVTAGTEFTTYTLNYSGRFGGANSSRINKIVIFLNPGGPAFTGTVYFDDLIVGDAIPYVSPGPIRVNQVGYEANGRKIAVLERSSATFSATNFELVDNQNTVVFSGNLSSAGQVDGWTGRYFWVADFSAFKTPGTYKVKIGSMVSHNIEIRENLLFEKTAFSVVDFFKGMRHTGSGDASLSFNGPRNDTRNVYGGWWDATGDPGKHFSHLSYANYFNPQQIPMVVWSLLKSYEMDPAGFSEKRTDLMAEVKWGGDYILRNLDPQGYFYLSIFDDWGNVPWSREICEWGVPGNNAGRTPNYQAAFREGGGMAIAALARAYYMDVSGDSSKAQYLNGAKKAYAHLKSAGNEYPTKNLEYCNDHKENIIDDYCALLAAIELYKATGSAEYKADAALRADRLLARQHEDGWFKSDDEGNRPFYHAADEGLPLVALMAYMDIDPSKNSQILSCLRKSINWYISISKEIVNPFNYIRQYNKAYADNSLQTAQKRFFVPKDNETGYWWQGENARLASMSTALLMASRKLDPGFVLGNDSISTYALSQLDWILGKNPFDVCMMYGFGVNTYPDYPVASAIPNIKGGICNGITSKTGEETDISWMPFEANSWENWRWIEQWLPHDAWYILAVSSLSNINNSPANSIAEFADFSVNPSASGITLNWATISELNGDVFEIHKSLNGTGFTIIGTVPAGGNQSGSYDFTDPEVSQGSVSYKIVFRDLNNNTVTSETITLVINSNYSIQDYDQIVISGNPFVETTAVTISEPGSHIINISDISGKTSETITFEGTGTLRLGEKLKPGMYILEISSGTEIKTFKLIKK